MNSKNCLQCRQANPIETKFCYNCGTPFTDAAATNSADQLQPTIMSVGGSGYGNQNYYGNQAPPPNFQQQYQQSQQNWQPAMPPSFNPPPQSSFSVKKILLGVGGVLFGLIMLASGGVKLYKAFSKSNGTTTTSSSTSSSQPLYNNPNSSSTNSSSLTPPSPSSPLGATQQPKAARTIADITQQKVGAWTLRETIQGNPAKDGFAGATDEKQFKYYDSRDDFVHMTIADFPSAAAAENSLRTQMANFKKLKLKIGVEQDAIDNDKNPIGITQTMTSANGKLHVRYWTNKNFLLRVLGTEKSAEDFFRASNF